MRKHRFNKRKMTDQLLEKIISNVFEKHTKEFKEQFIEYLTGFGTITIPNYITAMNNKNRVKAIYFGAEWCGQCRTFRPKFLAECEKLGIATALHNSLSAELVLTMNRISF